jgi:hypothetical protein
MIEDLARAAALLGGPGASSRALAVIQEEIAAQSR